MIYQWEVDDLEENIKKLEKRIYKLEQQNKLIIEKYNFAIDFIFECFADMADEFGYQYGQ